MGRRLKNIQLIVRDAEESDNSPATSGDSPRAGVSKGPKLASTSCSNRSRRSLQKRVVSVPIKDVQRFNAPPPDSWTWRKYGQKPIKGSPYPRGYYRCSSSKGCPARKQVERSKLDPDMIMVTYSCDHNHDSPRASRSNPHRTPVAKTTVDSVSEDELIEEDDDEEVEEEEEEDEEELQESGEETLKNPSTSSIDPKSEEIPDEKLASLVEGTLINGGEFGWFTDFEDSPSCAMLESPILMEHDRINTGESVSGRNELGDEDESLFADLEELPECSTVFRRGHGGIAWRPPLVDQTMCLSHTTSLC